MPNDKRTPRRSTAPEGPNAIVASAASVLAGRRKNLPSGAGVAWQNEAWAMLDTVGELEFYREWISNALSKCTLEAVEEVYDPETGETDEVPAKDPVVLAAMDALFGGNEGQSDMLAAMGGHIAIPGETWLVGLLNVPDDPDLDMWRVMSRDEVKAQGNRWQIDRGDGEPETYDSTEVYITRIWRPHPRKWVEANSSVRTALPILRQLVGLSKRDAANIDSRLIGNGILAVPTEMTFASPVDAKDDGTDLTTDPFLSTLIEAGITAIEDPGSPEALFPILVRGPAEHIDKIKHITLASDLDEKGDERQERLIKRLANSLDVPAEVLLGMADVNHWTGWLLDDNAIKMHVEPALAVIASGLTTRYMWACLQGDSQTLDPALRRFKVKGKTDALRQRPNKAAEAQVGRAALIITDKAWAREVGFEETDLLSHPDNAAELQHRLLIAAATGTATPDVTVAALAAAGVALTPEPATVSDAATPTPVAAAPAPRAIEAGTDPRSIPATLPASQAAAVLAVSEVMVLRAVERGWSRARGGRVRRPVPAHLLDAALHDAWEPVERTAGLTGVDASRLRTVLDTYARTLLTTGADHDPHALARELQAVVGDFPAPSTITRGAS